MVEIETDGEKQLRVSERTHRMLIRVIGLDDDHEAIDREYFARLTPSDKMTMVATM